MEAVRERKPKIKKAKEKFITDEKADKFISDVEPYEAQQIADDFDEALEKREESSLTDTGNERSDDPISSVRRKESISDAVRTSASENPAEIARKSLNEVVIPEQQAINESINGINESNHADSRRHSDVISSISPTRPAPASQLKEKMAVKVTESSVSPVRESVAGRNPLAKNALMEAVRSSTPLYPSLMEKQKPVIEPRPLTRTELQMYFVNAEAKALDAIVDHFIESNSTVSFYRHPLYTYLTKYLEAITAYESTMNDLKNMQSLYEQAREDVWKITDNRITGVGVCADNKTVTGEHHYRQCHLNEHAVKETKTRLEAIRHFLYNTSFQFKSTAELVKFQVECYLFDVLRNNSELGSLRDSASTMPRADFLKVPQTAEVRNCVGILFSFHRMPLGSDTFRGDLKIWLSGCVGILCRASTFFDQLFLLNHLLRVPSSVLSWASCFLQLSLPSHFSPKNCNNPYVKHLVVMLTCLLRPARSRDDFLSTFMINHSSEEDPNSDSAWVVVDPDAEGMEVMKLSTTMDVEESDVFHLLKQFPFDRLFSGLFGSDCVDLEPFVAVTELDVLSLFSFCHEFLELLVEGLDNPSLNKYPRFNKKNAQIIRELIIHCKEFWERLSEVKLPSDPILPKLRLNFEELVIRGMSLLLRHGKIGTLQFLVGWPTNCLSLVNLWRTVVMLESPPEADVPYRTDIYSWKRQLTDLHGASKLQDKLQFLDESNATYLLTAIAEASKQCDRTLPVSELIESVTLELLRISFLGPLRTTYAKLGRDLVCSICTEYPSLISEVCKFAWKNLDQVGAMGVFLFQEMPLKRWEIGRPDVEVICEGLVGAKTVQDPPCLLAREILSNLNWGYGEDGSLFVHAGIHQYVAVAIVEAFLKFISTKNRRLLLYESLLRLSNMVTTGKSTPEQNFVGWCWEVLLQLKLHRLSHHTSALTNLRNNSLTDDNMPNLARDAMSLNPLNAVQQRQPMASYVAVMLTDVGHSVTGVLQQGLDWISALVENYLYIPALEVLEMVTPLFFMNNQSVYLLQQDQFHYVLNCILQADATYLRMVKNILVSEFPGRTLKSFGNMVIHQILQTGPNLPIAIRFWCHVITSLKNWNRIPETLYLLDQVVKLAFHSWELETVRNVLRDAYEEYRQSQPARGGGMTALVSWMTSGSSPAYTLVESSKLVEAPWLGYVVLQVVTENSSGLWSQLTDVLTGEKKRTFEEGLKKAAHKMDLPVPAVIDLPIYQLAEILIAVKLEVEVFPLLCQEFFRLFLRRSATHGSIGDQFFLSTHGVKVMKPLKQKLRDAAEFYRKKAMALEERSPTFFQDLQRGVSAFALWLDEPKIHHSNFYLPSLPVEYEPELLRTVLASNPNAWMHFVDIQSVYSGMRAQAEHWLPFEVRLPKRHSGPLSSPIRCPDTPLSPPSTYPTASPFIPVDRNNLFDPSKVLLALRPDLTALQEAAKTFVNRIAEHAALDGYFAELIVDLNINTEKATIVHASCSKGQCAGPATINLKFNEFSRDDRVHRTCLQNREEWTGMIARAKKIDLKPLVLSVVRFEKAISTLVEAAGAGDNPRLAEVGAILFYHMLVFTGDETDEHPLTRKFFHSCVDVLGQNFVANQKIQCRPLLETALNNQYAIPVLIAHFTPNIVPQEFLALYKKSQTLQGKNNDGLIQLLSTFDVSGYLQEPKVDVSARLELLAALSYGITQLGSTPSFQDSPLFEIYAHHLRNLLEFRFPLHIVDILRCLLDLTGKTVLPPNGWSSCFFAPLGLSLSTEPDVSSPEQWAEDFATIRGVIADGRMSLDLAVVLAGEVTRYFSDFRAANKTTRLYGLFSVLGQYTRAVGVLLMTLSAVSLRDDSSVEGSFVFAVKLFQPWLNDEHAYLQADLPHASTLISVLRLIFSQITSKHTEMLRQIWQWFYYSFSVKPAEAYAVTAVTSELTKLNWDNFLPDDLCLQNFHEITQSGSEPAKEFVGSLVGRIPWQMVFSRNRDPNLPVFVGDAVKVMLFFATNEKFRPFKAGVKHFIDQTSTFEWRILDFSAVQGIAKTVAKDPELLATWCTATAPVENSTAIALLKLVTEFETDNLAPNQNTVDKRALFLFIYGRAAVAFYTMKSPNLLTGFFQATLKTMEKVWQSAEPSIRYHGNLALTSAFFSLSNYVADKKTENTIRTAVLTWIAENPGSFLLVPMITACCRNVVDMESMVAYLEVTIESYFRATGQHDWSPLVHALETPDLNRVEFVKQCLVKKAFLTLHAHLLRMLQVTEPERRGTLLQDVVDWCKVRPTPESQAKVFLLWKHVFLLSHADNSERSKPAMREFIESIFAFTEEKGGLLSAIGVGRPPVLSRPFKMISRSICAVGAPLTTARKTTGKSATLAVDTRAAYDEMKNRKEYATYSQVWSTVDGYLAGQGRLDWNDVRKMLTTLVETLLRENNYLTVISEL